MILKYRIFSDLDKVVTMEELATCEYNFLHAIGREHKNFESNVMKIGDENKDGKLHFEEWLTAGSVWDLGTKNRGLLSKKDLQCGSTFIPPPTFIPLFGAPEKNSIFFFGF